ncbi:hypothetical protein BG011_006805 [Mortierella polycephala]|uniref:Uncharacterized protein n=1 Tax=Mortierella polycephala TaxID=41804 RepID=A0A9P6U924_9FUNG|nr:hypothetical protein BG011_006805 [Mortierella polycephala]
MLFSKSLLLLSAVTVVLAKDRFDAIVSGVIQIGSDTTHGSASRLETFKNPENHVSAVASIILHFATKNKFLPSVDGVISDQTIYTNFMREIAVYPVFDLSKTESYKLELDGDPDQFVNQISSKYSLDDAKDNNAVARNFRKLIPERIQNTAWRDWLLSQVVINQNPSSLTVTVEIARVAVKLSHRNEGDAYMAAQTAVLTKSVFVVNSPLLSNNARRLVNSVPVTSARVVKGLLTTKFPSKSAAEFWEDEEPSCQQERLLYPSIQLTMQK